LSVFFRTHDAYRLGLPDLFFLRMLQREVLDRVKTYSSSGKLSQATIGELNVYYSRAFVFTRQRTAAMKLLERAIAFQRGRGSSKAGRVR